MNVIDCFTEIMAFTLHFTKVVEKNQPRYEPTFEKYNQLIINSRAVVNSDELSHNDWERSLFAVCAWVDEKILLSNWQEKELWQLNPLQKQYFRTSQAGEKFYEVMEHFDPIQDAQVIEVFNYCIKLGFQGKNFSNAQKNQLTHPQNLLNGYVDAEVKSNDIIFSNAYNNNLSTPPQKTYRFGSGVFLLIIAAVAMAGLGILDIIYNVLLNAQITGYFK